MISAPQTTPPARTVDDIPLPRPKSVLATPADTLTSSTSPPRNDTHAQHARYSISERLLTTKENTATLDG
ncbi:hypothetical protein GWI33_017062 [Rhynchophorus ferrugineus]|uniref:Uncharacterized protein n=1 Tax=Rhynchophorus ferrugineus TaxID=354439 RepID=A0A834HZZ6_RHYFE|nr:hypothetical protein GWI33_017062 [Rhynchophorus ferrugineus]